MTRGACALTAIVCWTAAVCSGATDPFVGKWTLNASRSAIADQMTIQAAGKDAYTLTFAGSPETETVAADGKDHPGVYGTTVSVTIREDGTWKIERKNQGRTVLTAIWKLSGDGKTLSDAFTSDRPDGSSFTITMVYRRAAGTAGIPGTWETTDVKLDGVHTLEIRPYAGDGLSFISSDAPSPKDVTFDGKEHLNSAGMASAGRRSGPLSLELTDKMNGKLVDTRKVTVSADLKTLTVMVHLTGQRLPSTFVFDRD
ncbi:MAG TPA: hypothetical protein VFL12_09955 [Thermoanaerobaculia bacterium]|nr:hypothetical protein [Thermoanaerobaculia bacterium]